MRTYLYVCAKCGYDTAAYDLLTQCPICFADRKKLKLIGTSDDADIRERLMSVKSVGLRKSLKKIRAH